MLRIEARDRRAQLLDGDEVRGWWAASSPSQVHEGPAGTRLLGGWGELVSVDPASGRAYALLGAAPRHGEGASATIALADGWTLEAEATLAFDGGHTAIGGGSLGFAWFPDEEGEELPGPEERARRERDERARLQEVARASRRRRIIVRRAGVEAVLLDEHASDARGCDHVMWPPVAAPEGLLLRRARLSDTGTTTEHEALHPWLVALDGAVATPAVDGEPLGVGPLCGLPSGGWLMPTHDLLWLDGSDGHLTVVGPGGEAAPWTVGGEPVTPSRVLADLAPEVLAAVERPDPGWSDPWGFAAARADERESRLRLALEVEVEGRTTALAVSAPLDGIGALRLDGLARAEPGVGLALLP